ncbi:MAG: glutamine--tRNA ligase/YqeY domain fusion protein [Eubacteriales bacterium]
MGDTGNFIHDIIEEDLKSGRVDAVHTRFPPEPNGYLHIGHCKALAINFGAAKKYGGLCNLRMDDTNPATEDVEYVDSIKEDIKWLGFDWGDRFYYGSDYFEETYYFAVELIKKGLAYVCGLTPEELSELRGDIKTPAVSPFRDRPPEESLILFEKMRSGEFPEGKYTLRAKIDLASGNFWLRDPVIYRIKYVEHHRQGTKWCVFPMYDFAHPLQDAIEGITHSLCSLEYEIHRPLYNWVLDNCSVKSHSRQIEFARLNMTNTVMSKRFLRFLVESGVVDGWDDPRMPTLCGLRRKGYTPGAILDFCERIGVAKADSLVDFALLEHCLREELNKTSKRRVAVLDPVKVVITNFPEDKTEYFPLPDNPGDENTLFREVPFTREIYIEREDFSLNPPSKFHRLKPGGEVRLMGAFIIKCKGFSRGKAGEVSEIFCEADLVSRNNPPADGRKVKGTIHWVSAVINTEIDVNLYENLITLEDPAEKPEGKTFADFINPCSVKVIKGCKAESSLSGAEPGEKFQFVRLGYFCKDTKSPKTFNRATTLKGSKPF